MQLNNYNEFHKNDLLQSKIVSQSNFTYINILPLINKQLVKNMKIIDVGCGIGTIDFFLASKNFKITGLDISTSAINLCKKNAKILGISSKTKFVSSDFLEYSTYQKYDMVICLEVLEHLIDENNAVKKIYSLLKKNGILILSVPSVNSLLYRLGLIKKFDKRVGHIRRYSVEKLKILVEQHDFKILQTYRVEGFLRNSLFVFPLFGHFIKFIKGFIALCFTFVDNVSAMLFGESDIIVIARKK